MKQTLIFFGNIPHNKDIIELQKKGNVLYSSLKFQNNVLEALKTKYNVIEISIPQIGNFIKTKKLYLKNQINEKENIYSIGYLNLIGIKNVLKSINVARTLKKIIKKNNIDSTNAIFLSTSLHSPFINNILKFSKKIKSSSTCCIIPDLPEYMSFTKQGIIYKILKKIDSNTIYRKAPHFDSFITLTDEINNKVNCFKKPYFVFEGISEKINEISEPEKPFSFLYAGTISSQFNICELAEKFGANEKLKKFELQICGNGEDVKKLISICEKYNNVKYLGILNAQELHVISNKSYAFVNPRPPIGEYTKYSFPSKTITYLEYGKPVIAFFLSGYRNEYKNILEIPNNTNIDSFIDKIIDVANFSQSKYRNIIKRNQDFVKTLSKEEFVNKFVELEKLI